MKQSHINADAKHLRHFLDLCNGNWHNCVYVRCVSCDTRSFCNGSHFLYHLDSSGIPYVLTMADAEMIFSRIPEPTECADAITLDEFLALYSSYLKSIHLASKPCPCIALLRYQENAHYNW